MEPARTVFVGGDALVDGTLVRADVVVDDGVIVSLAGSAADTGIGSTNVEVVDCTGRIVAPGLIDLQCNGAVGLDITSDPSCIPDVAGALPRFGVTSFLPTVITAPAATRAHAIDSVGQAVDPGDLPQRSGHRRDRPGAEVLGLHLEGPIISPARLGVHPRRFVVDATAIGDEIDAWIDSGAVRLVTLAPETPGALDAIAHLSEGGIVVSAGHTEMDPDEFAAARARGLTAVTHLFNAMAPFGHRSPGPIGAVLADDAVVAGLICDGVHIDPVAVHAAWRALGAGRVVLVSDASSALGTSPGRFVLGGVELVHDHTGVRTVDGVLAGSALPLDQAARNLIEFTGCSLVEAIGAATATPADLLGLDDRGRIGVGLRGDLIVLDPDGELVATYVGGRAAHVSAPSAVAGRTS